MVMMVKCDDEEEGKDRIGWVANATYIHLLLVPVYVQLQLGKLGRATHTVATCQSHAVTGG
jgi:hypothetical protein